MFVCLYSSYRLILSFPHLVVILTTIGTPKNIFCFNNNLMKDSSKQDHPGKNNFVVLYWQNYAATICRHYHESSACFEYPKKPLLKSNHPKQNTCQIFLAQKILEIRNTPLVAALPWPIAWESGTLTLSRSQHVCC